MTEERVKPFPLRTKRARVRAILQGLFVAGSALEREARLTEAEDAILRLLAKERARASDEIRVLHVDERTIRHVVHELDGLYRQIARAREREQHDLAQARQDHLAGMRHALGMVGLSVEWNDAGHHYLKPKESTS